MLAQPQHWRGTRPPGFKAANIRLRIGGNYELPGSKYAELAWEWLHNFHNENTEQTIGDFAGSLRVVRQQQDCCGLGIDCRGKKFSRQPTRVRATKNRREQVSRDGPLRARRSEHAEQILILIWATGSESSVEVKKQHSHVPAG